MKRPFDLEERTFLFAKEVRILVRSLPRGLANIEDGKQLIRSSGAVGANYREANEALSKKDFVMRLEIARKEAKESEYWLRVILETNELTQPSTPEALLREAREITKILSAMIEKSRS